MKNRLRCGECGEIVKYREQVYLDFMNTIVHKCCYKINHEIKDSGTFEELINKYAFFDELKRNPDIHIIK